MKVLLITGASGTGKDSLIALARDYYRNGKGISFVKRYITRLPDENEQNYYVDQEAFSLLCKNDFFISHWQAHGNLYGIARSQLFHTGDDRLAIVSVSRGSIKDFEQNFSKVITLCLTVDKKNLRKRLLRRGRESNAAIEKRLARSTYPVAAENLIFFDNSENLCISGKRFLTLLDSFLLE